MIRFSRSLLAAIGVSLLLTVSGVAQLSGGSASSGASKSLASADRKFIKDAGEQVLSVVHLAEITRHKGPGSEELKKLNAKIKSDFDKIWGELGSVAQPRKVDLPNTAVTGNEKAMLDKLRKTDEARFEKPFLKALDKEMKKAAQIFEAGEKSIQEPELKTVASTWAPKIKAYADEVATAEAEASKRK